jgi:hypothetical protein
LSLDVLRAIGKSRGQVLLALWEYAQEKLGSGQGELENKVRKCLDDIKVVVENGQVSEVIAREFSFAIAEVIIGKSQYTYFCSMYIGRYFTEHINITVFFFIIAC